MPKLARGSSLLGHAVLTRATTSMCIPIWSDDGQARAILAGAAKGGAPGQQSVGPGQRSGAKRSALLVVAPNASSGCCEISISAVKVSISAVKVISTLKKVHQRVLRHRITYKCESYT